MTTPTPTTTPDEYATLAAAGIACALRDIADAIAGGRYDVLLDVADAAFLAGEVARLRAENASLRADYEFYLCAFCDKPVQQPRNAEEAWGLAGGRT